MIILVSKNKILTIKGKYYNCLEMVRDLKKIKSILKKEKIRHRVINDEIYIENKMRGYADW